MGEQTMPAPPRVTPEEEFNEGYTTPLNPLSDWWDVVPMRTALALTLMMLLAGLTLPQAAAAEPFMTDPADDQEFAVGFDSLGTAAPEPGLDEFAAADLLALDIEETSDQIRFRLSVRDYASTLAFPTYSIDFASGGEQWRVELRGHLGTSAAVSGWLLVETESDSWSRHQRVSPLESTREGNVLTVSLPKVFLANSEGKVPVKDDVLEGFTVRSSVAIFGGSFAGEARDLMPDTGRGPDFTLALGARSNGHLQLLSQDPFRVSNGGSTTFVYHATLVNTAPLDDTVTFEIEELPDGWEATIARQQFVPAESIATVTLLVSVPFKHVHGGVDEFTLAAHSGMKAGIHAKLQMGVLHTPIPQPAGHHDQLYFHTLSTDTLVRGTDVVEFTRLGMNTLSDHADDDEMVPSTGVRSGTGGAWYPWTVPLDPALAMGLDFDITKEGTLTAVIVPGLPDEARVRAQVYLIHQNERTVLAEGISEPQNVQRDQKATFEVPLKPTKAADYVPYIQGQNLYLSIEYSAGAVTCCYVAATPSLHVHDSSLQLPLNEYHDVITAVESTGPRLMLEAAGALEKRARPGTTMTYTFNVTNHGPDDTFVAGVAGTDAETGRVIPERAFTLASGAARQVTLTVHVPTMSADGHQLEVILLVRSQSDPSHMAFARTYTTATTGEDAQADESALALAAADSERETPLGGAALVVGSLVGAAMLAPLRRRWH